MSAKILVVDDSASDRLIVEKMLSGYNILTACDGLEAMQVIKEHADIDLIILDLNMPNMDGFQVLNALKTDERYKKLRTLILTNYDEVENEIKGLKMGAVDYIRKPVNGDSLKVRIDMHLELMRIQEMVEQKLYEQELTFDTVLQQAPVGVAVLNSYDLVNTKRNYIMLANTLFEQITGRAKKELTSLGLTKITHSDDIEEDIKNFRKLQLGQIKSYSIEKRLIKPDGSLVWLNMIIAPLNLSNDDKSKYICIIQDISKRKEIAKALAESERSKSVLLSNLPGMAYRCNYDHERTMQYVSAGCFELTGYAPENLLSNRDLSYNDLIAPKYRKLMWKAWKNAIANRQPFRFEYEIITAEGQPKWVIELGQNIYGKQGEVDALEGIVLDISDRKSMEDELRFNSEHDVWTGLYNRRHLENVLKKDTAANKPDKRAVIGVNLSSIHSLNRTYGFHYSQELIKIVAEALKSHCVEKCQLFITHENLFVFYIKAYKDKNELTEFSEAVVSTLKLVLDTERIGGGIGIVKIDKSNNLNVDQILKNLLITSEKAINAYDRDFGLCFYDKDLQEQAVREEAISRELALIATGENADRLFLKYQPIIELGSNQINSFEVLSRLRSDKLGIVPPLEFIPIAEKTKLIIPLGQRIIMQALDFLNTLKENGYSTISLSINISVIQLLRSDFVNYLFEVIKKKQVNPENIGLEITESVFASNYQKIKSILSEIKDFGIKIAIDDFGTEYSSLAREIEFNANSLKIDKYFIDKIITMKTEEVITGDIISIAHKLGHYVIAEGVEHEKQRQYLKTFGCDRIQGYLISKPLNKDAALEFLKNNKPES